MTIDEYDLSTNPVWRLRAEQARNPGHCPVCHEPLEGNVRGLSPVVHAECAERAGFTRAHGWRKKRAPKKTAPGTYLVDGDLKRLLRDALPRPGDPHSPQTVYAFVLVDVLSRVRQSDSLPTALLKVLASFGNADDREVLVLVARELAEAVAQAGHDLDCPDCVVVT